MSLITPEDLIELLKLQGIPESELEDSEVIQSWINLKLDEIISMTGLPVHPKVRKEYHKHFKGTLLETDWYPIKSIRTFKIGDVDLTENDYTLYEDMGIIFLNKNFNGFLFIEYVHAVTDEFISTLINPLISDMVLYHFKNGDNDFGGISSIHEMDTSISYDTDNSLGNRIYTRINDLKNNYNYSARIRWV